MRREELRERQIARQSCEEKGEMEDEGRGRKREEERGKREREGGEDVEKTTEWINLFHKKKKKNVRSKTSAVYSSTVFRDFFFLF